MKRNLTSNIIQEWEEKWELITPTTGSHIRAIRDGFYHHGLYFSDDSVIHFGMGNINDLFDAKEVYIHETALEKFLNGASLEVRKRFPLEDEYSNSIAEIKRIAFARLNEKGYDFLKNNCEHFCYSCIFNLHFSFQEYRFTQEVLKRIHHD